MTGGGTGIGAATARLLATKEWDLALVGRRAELLRETAVATETAGAASLVIASDLGAPEAPGQIVDAVQQRFGRLDGIVNNAAVIAVKPLETWTTREFDEHVAVNVRAPMFLIQAGLPLLRLSAAPAVVNVSSSSANMVRTHQAVYGMTKCALEYLTRSLAGELAPDGVRVNSIAPGPVATPIHETWADDLEAAYESLAGQVPLGRIAAAEEIALWVALLLDPSTGWVTGATIPVDGGQALDRV